MEQVNGEIEHLNLVAFGGHPEDDFNIGGVFTRSDPCPNIQVIRHELIESARIGLAKTAYYDQWTPEALKLIGFISFPQSDNRVEAIAAE